MKKYYLASCLAALFILSGCSDNSQVISSNVSHSGPHNTSQNTTQSSSDNLKHLFSTTDLGSLGRPIGQVAYKSGVLAWVGGNANNVQQNPNTVFTLDIATGEKTVIASTTYSDQGSVITPQISGRWITWIDSGIQSNRPQYSVYAYNRATKTIKLVDKFSVPQQTSLPWVSLQRNDLIWTRPISQHQAQILRTDLGTMNTKVLSIVNSDITPAPYVSGSLLVWENSSLPNWSGEIMLMDLKSGKISRVTSVEGPFAWPCIDGDYILYSPQKSQSAARNEIDVIDIRTNTRTVISTNDPFFWKIGTGYVTWSTNDPGQPKVYVQFLNSRKKILVGTGALPYPFADTIVWKSFNDSHVYLTTVR